MEKVGEKRHRIGEEDVIAWREREAIIFSEFDYKLSRKQDWRTWQGRNICPIPYREPELDESSSIAYVVVIPTRCAWDIAKKIEQLFKIFKEEAFFGGDGIGYGNLSIVVGVNWISSVDEEVNANKEGNARLIEAASNVNCTVFADALVPKWMVRAGFNPLINKFKGVDFATVQSKYKQLKENHRALAEDDVRPRIERAQKSMISLQAIRDWVKNSDAARAYVQFYMAHKKVVYLATMDDDSVTLKAGGLKGLFSRYSFHIDQLRQPDLLSTGYYFASSESLTVKWAGRIDAEVRQAMNRVIPGSAYLPEPNFLLLIKSMEMFEKISYRGEGKQLESKRLIENAQKNGLIDYKKIHFIAEELLQTATPVQKQRLVIKQLDGKLLSELVRMKVFYDLLALVSQTHANAYTWAEQVIFGLRLQGCSSLSKGKYASQLLDFSPLYYIGQRITEYTGSPTGLLDDFKAHLSAKKERMKATDKGTQRLIEKAAIKSGEAMTGVLQLMYQEAISS